MWYNRIEHFRHTADDPVMALWMGFILVLIGVPFLVGMVQALNDIVDLRVWLARRWEAMGRLRVGDHVIYAMTKRSLHPGPRARDVYPEPRGDQYTYVVDKLWTVKDVPEPGRIVVQTRRGKEHALDANDAHLRKAHLWDVIRVALTWHRTFPPLSG